MAFAVLLIPLLLAGSAPAQPKGTPLDAELERARAEHAAAEAQLGKLEQAVADARGEADRLRAQRNAAAQGIEAAEARITAADAQLRLVSAYLDEHRQRLLREQRPASSLLAGLALMARRPPLLTLAGGGGADELVKVRILLDATLPEIRARTARLGREVARGEQLREEALAARAETARSRRALIARREQFAGIEHQALERAMAAGRQALGVGDVAIAAAEDVERLRADQTQDRAIAAGAAELAQGEPAPARPFVAASDGSPRPFDYQLPAVAPVTEGFGAVNASGVRARGLTLDTARGAAVTAPAAGVVRFTGPFQIYDGVLLIDHGGGWISLIVNVASPLKRGDRVSAGQPVGRALGPLLVELSQNGHRISPAIIAGSSRTLSKAGKGG